jgi:hypothetical protein
MFWLWCIPRYRTLSVIYTWLLHWVILNENLFKRGTSSAELKFCIWQSVPTFVFFSLLLLWKKKVKNYNLSMQHINLFEFARWYLFPFVVWKRIKSILQSVSFWTICSALTLLKSNSMNVLICKRDFNKYEQHLFQFKNSLKMISKAFTIRKQF